MPQWLFKSYGIQWIYLTMCWFWVAIYFDIYVHPCLYIPKYIGCGCLLGLLLVCICSQGIHSYLFPQKRRKISGVYLFSGPPTGFFLRWDPNTHRNNGKKGVRGGGPHGVSNRGGGFLPSPWKWWWWLGGVLYLSWQKQPICYCVPSRGDIPLEEVDAAQLFFHGPEKSSCPLPQRCFFGQKSAEIHRIMLRTFFVFL